MMASFSVHGSSQGASTGARGLGLVLAMSVLTPTWAMAVEPEPLEPEEEALLDDEPSLEMQEPEYFARVRELIAQGEVMFEVQDYVGAIEPWQKAYDMLTLCERGQLFVPLAIAHWRAYEVDRDEVHLRRAKAMFDRGLESVGNVDERTRRDALAQLSDVEAELDRLAKERAAQERERAARAAVEEERQRREAAEYEALYARSRRRFGTAMGIGGTATILGGLSLGAMAINLAVGARIEREGEESAADPNSSPMDRQALRVQGERVNQAARVTGIIGSTLVLVGVTAFVGGVLQRRGFRRRTQARITPSWRGMEVRF